ncbi:MAG: hypothetical protein ACRYF4_07595 [Janthinobacterium lividum]
MNDPTIGGMYDRAGGHFLLDEQKQMFFLVRDFTLSQTDEASFVKQVDALSDIAGIWVMKWLGIVADQSHGAKPKPTQRIDREHDPYPRGY